MIIKKILSIIANTIKKYLKLLNIKAFAFGISISAIFIISTLVIYFKFINPKIEISGKFSDEKNKNFTDKYEQEISIKENDIIIGDVSSPITVISYDSFSCSHCAFFYSNTFNIIKKNYIDRKIVKFIHRDFPTDKVSIDVSRLNHCYQDLIAKNDVARQFSLIVSIYSFQNNWLKTNYLDNVKKYFKIAGMTDKQIDQCLLINDNSNYVENSINEIRRIASILNISGTPTIFVNGFKNDNKNSPELISKMIDDAYINYKLSLEGEVDLEGGTGDSDNNNTEISE